MHARRGRGACRLVHMQAERMERTGHISSAPRPTIIFLVVQNTDGIYTLNSHVVLLYGNR